MNCKHCGKEMQIETTKMFCSKKCRDAYYYRHGRVYKECIVCGKELTGRQRSYCSFECERLGRSKYISEYKSTNNKKPEVETPPPKKRGKPEKKPSLAEINEKARAEGLSYGQYVGKYGL